MPILFMALIALFVFLIIPIMCTSAVIAEHHFAPKLPGKAKPAGRHA